VIKPSDSARAPLFLPGSGAGTGRGIGILMLHGFLGSPASIAPWAHGLQQSGFTVSAPCMSGHEQSWQHLATTEWSDWYASAESAFLELRKSCDRIFVAGFSMGGAIALRLAEIRGSEIEGVILLNPSVGDDRKIFSFLPILKYLIPSVRNGPTDVAKPGAPAHIFPRTPLRALDSLRQLWKRVRADLYLVDLPLMIAYSEDDHTVDPYWSRYVLDNVYSPTVRELIFERSFHNVALDYDAPELIDETVAFIHDVLSGDLELMGEEDETELINAEFESIVSGLSLDQSSPTSFLNELDRPQADDFVPPNPPIAPTDDLGKFAVGALLGGTLYLTAYGVIGFDLFGFGPWPGVLSFITGVLITIYKFARPDEELDGFDDGAVF
jgi:carboxylesterase